MESYKVITSEPWFKAITIEPVKVPADYVNVARYATEATHKQTGRKQTEK